MNYWLAFVGIVSTHFVAIAVAWVVYIDWRRYRCLAQSVEELQHEVTRLHVRLDMRESTVSRTRGPARTS